MVAISLGTALVASAVIGAGASAISASGSKKAINRATDATTAQARDANALAAQTRDQNIAINQPGYNTGMAAMGQMNALLGLEPAGYANPMASAGFGQPNALASASPYEGAGYGGGGERFGNGSQMGGFQAASMQPQQPQGNITAQPTRTSAMDAYNRFKEYGGYTTRLDEGNKNLNAAFAGRGTLQSGAAAKASIKFGQDYASNEFGNYLGYLGGQQNLYSGAANALSGVNSNYTNIVNGNNRDAANAIGNGALAKANVNNQMIGGIANSLGSALGGLSSSYKPIGR